MVPRPRRGGARRPRARELGLLATRFVAAAVAIAAVLLVAPRRPATAGVEQVEPPAGYYDHATGLAGTALRDALYAAISPHTRLSYGGAGEDGIRAVLERAQEHPTDALRVLDVYRNMAWLKVEERAEWDREHAWPSSYGFPDEGVCNFAYNDAHHLFAADDGYNSSRGNKYFDDCTDDCTPKTVEPDAPGQPTPQPNLADADSWEVWPRRRGDIARAILYMDVRYEGGVEAGGESEPPECASTPQPQLIVTDDPTLIVTTGGESEDAARVGATVGITATSEDAARIGATMGITAYMGIKSTLLRWHLEDPVDDWERRRNEVVWASQHNRNPFIDHPHFACFLYGRAGCAAQVYLPFAADDFVRGEGGAGGAEP